VGGDHGGRHQREPDVDLRVRSLRTLIRAFRKEWPWWLGAALATAPVWFVRHLPAQDLPEHMTVIRILRSLHDPAFGFDADYVPVLGRTTYVVFYLLGAGLAWMVGVFGAAKSLVAAYLAGTLLGVRALARAIGGDERVAVFAAPLLVNPLFVIGLLPFLFGVMVMVWAIAAAITYFRSPTLLRGALAAALGLILVELHPLPYVLFVFAVALQVAASVFAPRMPRTWNAVRVAILRAAAIVGPSLVVFARWLLLTTSGAFVRRVMEGRGGEPRLPLAKSFLDAFGWIGDAFRDKSDDYLFGAMLGAAIVAFVLGRAARPSQRSRALALSAVPILATLLYFFGQPENGYAWPLCQRYAVIAALTVVPLLRLPRGNVGSVWTAVAATLGAAIVVNDAVHFVRFDREARGIDDAIAVMRPRAHVAALFFESASSVVRFHPYVHAGAYYQVDRGGVVKFTFAGYDHWPIDFRPGRYPPPGAPAAFGWEWHPDRVSETELVPYFDYVLVRGVYTPPGGAFVRVFDEGPWHVWQRRAEPHS
jgi:hypothetical protein